MRWTLAALHLLTLGIGLGAIWVRSRLLRGSLDLPAIRNVLSAHRWWGLAGHLWIVTGALRAFSGIEKGPDYYLQSPFFHIKMGLLLLLVALEAGPLLALRRWRKHVAVGVVPDTARAMRFSRISVIQAMLVVLMVIVATGMARGYGLR